MLVYAWGPNSVQKSIYLYLDPLPGARPSPLGGQVRDNIGWVHCRPKPYLDLTSQVSCINSVQSNLLPADLYVSTFAVNKAATKPVSRLQTQTLHCSVIDYLITLPAASLFQVVSPYLQVPRLTVA